MKAFPLFVLVVLFACSTSAQQPLAHSTFISGEDSSTQLKIGSIQITGNRKTREHIVRREFFFREGDTLAVSELAKRMEDTRNYLMNTALFVDVNVYIKSKHSDTVVVGVDLQERWYIFPLPYFKLVDRNFNQWWVEHKRSLERVNYGLKFMWYNFTGRRDNLYVYLVTGYNRQVQLRYEQPFIERSLKHGLGVMVQYNKQREISYSTQFNKQVFLRKDRFLKEDLKLELGYYYRPAIKSRHNLRISYNKVSIDDSLAKFNPGYLNGKSTVTFPEFGYTFTYLGADYIPYPTKGVLAKLELIKRGLNSPVDMWQFNSRIQYTHPIMAKTQLQVELMGTLKLPFEQPYYNQVLLGHKELYLRGLEYYVVDGVAGLVGKTTLQTQVLSFTLTNPYKIRSLEKIPVRVMLKLYGDAGFAHIRSVGSNMLNNKLLRSWGVGMDIVTIYDLVLKIEYSFNQLGDRGLFLHSKNEF